MAVKKAVSMVEKAEANTGRKTEKRSAIRLCLHKLKQWGLATSQYAMYWEGILLVRVLSPVRGYQNRAWRPDGHAGALPTHTKFKLAILPGCVYSTA